jgi:type I restriction enzyme M protein
MILDMLRGETLDYVRLEVLLSLYLVGYVRQLGQIENVDEFNKITDFKELEIKLLDIFEDITIKYPILEVPLEELKRERLLGKLNQEIFQKLVKIIIDVPFSKHDWKDAVEDLVRKVSEVFRYIDIEQTPETLNKLGMEILNPVGGSFYDGVAGTNGTAIYASKYSRLKGEKLDIYVQELNPKLVNIGIIRAFINGIDNINVYVGDTLLDPGFKEENRLKVFDTIMMDFPFGQSWRYDDNELIYDKYSRYVYGKPTKSSAEWLYISHIIKSLSQQGKGLAMVTSSSLFNTGTETIRENIIKEDVIEAIIELPSGLFNYTNIAVNIMVINKSKKIKNKILFINAEEMATPVSRTKKDLNDENITTIVDIYNDMKEIDEISRLVDIKELENNLLIPSKYVSKSEVVTDQFGLVKIKPREMKQLKNIKKFSEIASFYRGINTSTCTLNEENGECRIINLSDVQEGELIIDSIARYDLKSNSKINAYEVQEGDLIISAKGAAIKICIIPKLEVPLLISQNFIGIRPNKGYSPSYLKEYLESPLGIYLIESKQLGSTITMLNIKDLKDIEIVTLPVEKQDEIMMNYIREATEIKEKMETLENQARELKIELYKQMKIEKTLEMMEE